MYSSEPDYIKDSIVEKSDYYVMSDVKERGWTDAMIRDFLGSPDALKNSQTYRGTVYKLYLKKRVEEAEKLEDFIVWKTKLDARRVKRKEKETETRFAETLSNFRLSPHWNVLEENSEENIFEAEVVCCGCVWRAEISALEDKWYPVGRSSSFSKKIKIGCWENRNRHPDSCSVDPDSPLKKPEFETEHPQWCAIDVEIACPEENYGSICGIGVAVFDGNGNHIRDISREWKVRPPGNKYDPMVVKEVRLKPSETSEADSWEKISEEVASLVGDKPIVFHAAENEMRQMVSYENCWIPKEEQIYCSQRMAHFLSPSGKMGLVDLCGKYNIPIVKHHNPLADAVASGWLWQFLCSEVSSKEKDGFRYFKTRHLPDGWMFRGLPMSSGQRQYLSIITSNTGTKPSLMTLESQIERLDTLKGRQEKEWSEARQKVIEEVASQINQTSEADGCVNVSWHGVVFSIPAPPSEMKNISGYVMGQMSRGDASKVLNSAVPSYKRNRDRYYDYDYDYYWYD